MNRAAGRAVLMSLTSLLILSPALVLPILQIRMDKEREALAMPLPEYHREHPAATTRTEVKHGAYLVRLLNDGGMAIGGRPGGTAEVWHAGKRIWSANDHMVYFESLKSVAEGEEPVRIADINADGYPEVLLMGWSGGAHAAYTYWLWSLRPTPTCLMELPLGNGQLQIQDLDEDGIPEVIVFDDTFAYWRTCFAESPMPKIIYRWNGWRYCMATSSYVAISTGEKERQVEKARKFLRSDAAEQLDYIVNGRPLQPRSDLWAVMLEAIYAGEGAHAYDLICRAWPEHVPGRTAFMTDFDKQVRSSPFWGQTCEMTPREKRWPRGPYPEG